MSRKTASRIARAATRLIPHDNTTIGAITMNSTLIRTARLQPAWHRACYYTVNIARDSIWVATRSHPIGGRRTLPPDTSLSSLFNKDRGTCGTMAIGHSPRRTSRSFARQRPRSERSQRRSSLTRELRGLWLARHSHCCLPRQEGSTHEHGCLQRKVAPAKGRSQITVGQTNGR